MKSVPLVFALRFVVLPALALTLLGPAGFA
jgi:hypothetical protein